MADELVFEQGALEFEAPSTETFETPAEPVGKSFIPYDEPTPYDDIFNRASAETGVAASTLKRFAYQESRFNPNAEGPMTRYGTAKGMMQSIDSTSEAYGITDPYDPEQSIMGMAQYIRDLDTQFNGDPEKIVAGYNWGPTNVRNYGLAKAPKETRDYLAATVTGDGTFSIATDEGQLQFEQGAMPFEVPAQEGITFERAGVQFETPDGLIVDDGDPAQIRTSKGVPIDDVGVVSKRDAERMAAKRQHLQRMDEQLEEIRNSNAPGKDVMIDAIMAKRKEIAESPTFDDKSRMRELVEAATEGLKQVIPDHTASVRNSVMDTSFEFSKAAKAETPEEIKELEKLTMSHTGGRAEVIAIRNELMEANPNLPKEEATLTAMKMAAQANAERNIWVADKMKKVEEAEIFKPNSDVRAEMEARGSTLDEVVMTLAGTSGEMASFFINPLFGATVTYNRLKGATTRDLEERIGRNIEELNARNRDQGLPELTPEDVHNIVRSGSMLSAGLQLPTEVLSNLIKVKGILGSTNFGKWARGMVNAYVGETATEFVQQYQEEAAIIWALNRDLSPMELAKFMWSKEPEIRARAQHAGHIGGLSGLLTGGIAGGTRLSGAILSDYISSKQKEINSTKTDRHFDERRRVQEAELSAEDKNVAKVFEAFDSPREKSVKEEVADRIGEKVKPSKKGVEIKHEETLGAIVKDRSKRMVKAVKTGLFDRVDALGDVSREGYKASRVFPGRMDAMSFFLEDLKAKLGPLEGAETFWDGYVGSKRMAWRDDNGIPNPGGVTAHQARRATKALIKKWASKKFGTDKPTIEQRAEAKSELAFLEAQWSEFFWNRMVLDSHRSGMMSTETLLELQRRKDKGEFYAAVEILEKQKRYDPDAKRSTVAGERMKRKQVGATKESKQNYPTDGTVNKMLQMQVLFERNKVVRAMVTDPKRVKANLRPIIETGKDATKRTGKTAKVRKEELEAAGEQPVYDGDWDGKKFDVVTYYEDGVKTEFLAPVEVVDALNNMSSEPMNKLLQLYNNIFRRTATTLNPGFLTTNAVRDGYLSYLASPVHSATQPITFMTDWAGRLKDAYRGAFREEMARDLEGTELAEILWKKEPLLWKSHSISGGGFGWTKTELHQDLQGKNGFLAEFNTRTQKLKSGKKSLVTRITSPVEWAMLLEKFNETIEYAPRLAIRKRILQNLNADIWNQTLKNNTGFTYQEILDQNPELATMAKEAAKQKFITEEKQIKDGQTITRENPDIWLAVNKAITDQAIVMHLRNTYPNLEAEVAANPALHDKVAAEVDRLKTKMISDASMTISFMTRQAGLDFNAGGTWSKVANKIKPFFNARMRGIATQLTALGVMKEGGKRGPEFSTMKGKVGPISQAWLKFTMINTLPTMAAFAMSKLVDPDDEMRQDIPDYIKNRYWVIPLGWVTNEKGIKQPAYIEIPKGELGVWSNNLEKSLYQQYREDPRFINYIMQFLEDGQDALSPIVVLGEDGKPSWEKFLSNLPPALLFFVQSTSNADFYRERPIETAGMQNKLPYERFTDRTPKVYIDMSRTLWESGARGDWISPVRLQKMAEDIGTVYGREGAGLEELNAIIRSGLGQDVEIRNGFRSLITSAFERNFRIQGGAILQANWKTIQDITLEVRAVQSEAKEFVAAGDLGRANALITKWNAGVMAKLQDVDVERLTSLGYKFRGNKGLRNAFIISTTERRNLLRGREDERDFIERKIEGRR